MPLGTNSIALPPDRPIARAVRTKFLRKVVQNSRQFAPYPSLVTVCSKIHQIVPWKNFITQYLINSSMLRNLDRLFSKHPSVLFTRSSIFSSSESGIPKRNTFFESRLRRGYPRTVTGEPRFFTVKKRKKRLVEKRNALSLCPIEPSETSRQ